MTIKHTGVKGMKWGIRRNRNRPGGADGKEESEKIVDKRGKFKKTMDSLKREREWNKILREIDHLSTKDISTVTKRIALENSLKKLSKSKMARPKDKEDYLNRDKMSNEELSRKVVRLQAKDVLHRTVKDASKAQREFGERVVNVGGGLAMKYAKGKKLGFVDILDSVTEKKPKTIKETLQTEAMDKLKRELERLDKRRESQVNL